MEDKNNGSKEPWVSGFYMPKRYFLLFIAQFAPCMAVALIAELFEAESAGIWTSASSVVFAVPVAGSASIIGTVVLVNMRRLLMALIDALLIRPTKKSDQIRAEGYAQGVTATLEWVRERDEHAKRGEPFDKPPPGINKNHHA